MVLVKLIVVLFIYTSLLVNKSHAQTACPGANYARHINRRMRCGIFKTLTLNWIDCPKQCTATLNCFSFNTYQSDNGTETCELVRGTNDSFQDKECLVKKDGSDHYELTNIYSCSPASKDCKTGNRRILSNAWYQLGSSAFKHFKTKKTWKDANDVCSANKASLVTINNELENRFITELFLKSKDILKLLAYWKFDGTDKNIGLYGNASYQKDPHTKTAVLDLPGTIGSYATTPRIYIQTTSYTIAFWVKLRSIPSAEFSHLYSHPVYPYMFSVGVHRWSNRLLVYHVGMSKSKPGGTMYMPRGGNLILNKWSYIVGTWDRTTKRAVTYQDGIRVGQVTSGYIDVDLPDYGLPFCNVGRRFSNVLVNAAFREMIVLAQPLSSMEVIVLQENIENLFGAWAGSTHPYINLVPVLRMKNSPCVLLRSWEPYQRDKVSCDQRKGFICEKRLD